MLQVWEGVAVVVPHATLAVFLHRMVLCAVVLTDSKGLDKGRFLDEKDILIMYC